MDFISSQRRHVGTELAQLINRVTIEFHHEPDGCDPLPVGVGVGWVCGLRLPPPPPPPPSGNFQFSQSDLKSSKRTRWI